MRTSRETKTLLKCKKKVKKDGKGLVKKTGLRVANHTTFDSEKVKSFWRDPVLRQKYIENASKKRKISPEVTAARVERLKRMHEERVRTGYYEKVKKTNAWKKTHDPEIHRQIMKRRAASM